MEAYISKTLRTAALVVGAVALVATGIGAAASLGAFGAIAAGSATAATLSTIATVATVASFASGALTLAATLTAKKPLLNGSGAQTSWKADPNAGIPYLIGRTGTGGNIIMRKSADGWSGKTNNDLSDFVTILSGAGPVQEIESYAADKIPVTFDAGGNANGTTFRDYMFQKWQLGVAGASALAVAAGTSAAPIGWDSSHKLSGYAASMLRLRFDSDGKHYQNGTPPAMWVVKGVKVYDPRLDSTYPGGSGSCRALNESTYIYSENPYLHALTWCLGRFQNGQRVLGGGVPIAGIDVAAFVEGANVADVNGWKVGGVIYSTDNKWEVLKAILQAGSGEPMRLGAKISCRVDTPRVSLATITIDDVWGDVSVQATIGQKDRINGVVPTYRDEGSNWAMVPAAPIRVGSYVTFDGYSRTKPITYSLVQSVNQAAVLARYEIENAREFPMSIPLRLRWMGYKPGDCVTVTLPEDGLNAQDVLLMNRSLDPATGTVTIQARTETFAKHAFALGQTGVAPPTPTVTGPPLTPTPLATDWTIAASSLGGGGNVVPALVVVGAAVGTADDVIIEFRLYTGTQTDDQDWQSQGIDPPSVNVKVITDVKGGSPYQVSIRYRRRGVAGTRLILGPTTTAVPTLVDATSALAQINAIVADNILDKSEKPEVVQEYGGIIAEQSGIDTQATSFGVTTEKTAYDNAVSALTLYLGTLSPAYNSYTTDTSIVRSVFISKFTDVYTTRQALLNKLATFANWSGVSGTGRPADYATQNVDGANMIPDPLGYTGGALANGAVYATINASGRPVERKAIQLAFGANALGHWSGLVPVFPGETLYYKHVVKSDGGTTETCNASYSYYDASGASLGAVNLGGSPYNTSRTLASVSSAWTVVACSFVVPAGAAFVRVYIERPAFTGYSFFLGEPFLGRAQQGATLGAPNPSDPVGTITAGSVSATVRSGGGLNTNIVDTPSIQGNAVTELSQAYNPSGVAGSGITTFTQTISFSVTMAQAGDIFLLCAWQQKYIAGSKIWSGRLILNDGSDHVIGIAGDANLGYTSSASMIGKYSVAAGTYTVRFDWAGQDANIYINAGEASLMAMKRYK